ncbi:MAG: hypothetical protein QJT81_03750 [Candidatus Thiothrix putei]|uniref:Uncharacterized protein n=1 Tax=Candidatus Thiothrix putei TaxID=3080811 RepID=A0AA95KNH8_9GAMM|nr:MAG: hypothetical protein QJT81_03750 [Candidatus Thiothrix putei]
MQVAHKKGVKGLPDDLIKVSALFEHHPLTLALLGNYLSKKCANDLSKLDTIPVWLDKKEDGRVTRRILAAYEKWLSRTPELALAYLLSMADSYHLSTEVIEDLLKRIALSYKGSGLTRPFPKVFLPLRNIKSSRINQLKQNLGHLDLLTVSAQGEFLEMPVSVREYFVQNFKRKFYEDWQKIRNYSVYPKTALRDSNGFRP